MISNLPIDILYEICKYLSIRDIYMLKSSNNQLCIDINHLQNNLLILELKKMYCIKIINVNYQEEYVSYFSDYTIKYFYIVLTDYLEKNKTSFDNITINVLNTLDNNIQNIEHYPYKLELILLYNYIQICNNNSNIDYFVSFLKTQNDMLKDNMYNVKLKYYEYVIYAIHYNWVLHNLTFSDVFYISKYIVNVSMLKMLMTFKNLDLKFTKFEICCISCNSIDLLNICEIKKQYYKNDLVNYNYNQIKSLLRRENPLYYGMMINKELQLVNELIYVNNPITNKRICIGGNVYPRMMRVIFKASCNNEFFMTNYISILKHIDIKQNALRKKFFT
jgi:hypothetical protein